MSVETSTTTSTSGSTTTVGATVRDPGGPGGKSRYVDIHLLIEPAKAEHAGPGSPSPTETDHDSARLAVWWKDQKLAAGGKIDVTYKIARKSGDAYEGAIEGTLIVSDRSKDKLYVKRFSLCPQFRIKPVFPLVRPKSKRSSKGK
jgi:hypothetical protein